MQSLLEANYAVGIVEGLLDENLTVTYASRLFYKHLGYSTDNVKRFNGHSFLDVVYPEDRALFATAIACDGEWPTSFRLADIGGAPVYVQTRKRYFCDEQGRSVWLMSVRVSPEAETLALISDVYQSGTWSLDCDDRGNVTSIVYSNKLRQMLGCCGEADFPNTLETFLDVVHPDDLEEFKRKLFASLTDMGHDFHFDATYRAHVRGNGYKWFRSVGNANRRRDGSVSHAVGVFFDVDEIRRKEELSEALKRETAAKDQMIDAMVRLVERYMVCDIEHDSYEFYKADDRLGYAQTGPYSALLAHMDLRHTPLEGDAPFSELLSPDALRASVCAKGDVLRLNYETIDDDRFFELAVSPMPLEDGKLTRVLMLVQDVTQMVQAERRSRQALVDDLVIIMQPQIEEHHHAFAVDIRTVEHEDVIGDSLRIRQVLVNLLGNAVKYTPDGGNIRLTLTEKPSNQTKVACYEFTVEDDGIGMSPETVAAVFEPFTRARDSRAEQVRAAGVSAFITKPLFKSRLINTFDEIVNQKTSEPDEPLDELSSCNFTGRRVLVVEDNQLNSEVAKEILEFAGITVECAFNGVEAVQMVTDGSERFDLVLMDVMMPKMDGHEATRAIRASGSTYCATVPIVAMTANAFADDVRAAKAAGMNEHIAKPLDLRRLARVLGSYWVFMLDSEFLDGFNGCEK